MLFKKTEVVIKTYRKAQISTRISRNDTASISLFVLLFSVMSLVKSKLV